MADGVAYEVFLKFLPATADEAGIAQLFKDCGEIVGEARLLRDNNHKCKGVGWLTFATKAAAEAAVARETVKYGGRNVCVSMAKQVSWSGGHAGTVGGVAGSVQSFGTHTPAMGKEVVAAIVAADRDGVFVDGTFGRGGHTRLILQALGPQGRLHAFDLDPEAIKVGKKLMKEDSRFRIHHCGFKGMAAALEAAGEEAESVTGVFLDLGISSPQLDEAARGFRPEQSGPLDLRFDVTSGQSGAEFLRDAPRSELIRVFRDYGDVSDPHTGQRVADAVMLLRATGKETPKTTKEFSDLVASCRGYEYQAMHPAKTVFQALRIHLNDEFGQFRGGLAAAMEVLKCGGRVGVLTWKHSECALLVEYLRKVEVAPPNFPLLAWHKSSVAEGESEKIPKAKGFVADAAKRPSPEELRLNSRSRSAVLHLLRKQRGILAADLEASAAAAFGWDAAEDVKPKKKKKRETVEVEEVGPNEAEERPKSKRRKQEDAVECEQEAEAAAEEEAEKATAKKKKKEKKF